MGTKETQLEKKCPNCGAPLFRWTMKNPFIDDCGEYCKKTDDNGEFCYGQDPSYGASRARENARREG